jgi:hypothetical protein
MSTGADDFLTYRHTGSVTTQLASGVRAFMPDLWYGVRRDPVVRTDFLSQVDLEAAGELDVEQAAATMGVVATIGPPSDERQVYLCHVYCELGSTPAVETFRAIDDYLRENPNEVIVLILEDHVDAADAVSVLERGGLARHALEWEPGEPLPTLREMIERKRNVLVLVEYDGGAEPWYIQAYDAIAETPYEFASRSDFSCGRHRGVEGNALFLVNHWLTTPGPEPIAAADVNRSQVLRDRVAECEAVRGRRPNIIAVDFYTQGDLIDVVDELNAAG